MLLSLSVTFITAAVSTQQHTSVDTSDTLPGVTLIVTAPFTDSDAAHLASHGVSGGQAVSGSLSHVRMGGKRPALFSRGVQPSVQFGGAGRPRRGRDRGLQENQLLAVAGVPQQRIHPQVLAAQPATFVLTSTHSAQHPHCCKTTHTPGNLPPLILSPAINRSIEQALV